MAQYDTGQGWSANEEWLFARTGTVANIGGFSFPGYSDQPIPQNCINYAGVVAGGFVGFTYQYPGDTSSYYYGAQNNDDVLMCLIQSTSTTYTPHAISLTRNAIVLQVDSRSGGSQYNRSYTLSSYIDVGGVRFYLSGMSAMQVSSMLQINIPIFSTIQEACAAISIAGTAYNKLNPGYAVACGAEWVTPAGTILRSPILISPDSAAVVMTTDGTTPAANMEVFDFLKDGVRFYMSLIAGNTDPVTTNFEYADLTQFMAALPSKVFSLLASESFANILIIDSPDPYGQETDPSAEEGGDGDTDPEDDPVDEETLPIPAVSGLGFSTIYVPTEYDLYQLASYLWSGNLDLDNFLRLFANPMDSILGLSAVPVALSGTYEPIYLGGQLLQGVTMPRYSGRTAVKVDMGSTRISKRWGSYLDYDPYTEFSVYLPFIGIKNIKADDIMEKTVSLMYNIDILSGACVAYLRTAGGSVLYEWAGQCAMQIPITGANWDNIFSTAISTAVTLGGTMVAPANAPVLAGSVASAAVQAVAAKPRVERSGAVTGVTGFLGQLRPYIIRTIPEAYIPNEQNKFIGYPSYISVNLGSLTGYNEVASIHLENIPATGNELSELENILKGGVIF